MQKQSTNDKDDWGNPPHPTPENRKKAMRAQIVLGLVSLWGYSPRLSLLVTISLSLLLNP